MLEIDLTRPTVTAEPEDLIGRLRTRQAVQLRSLVRAIHDGATDHRVTGLVATVTPGLELAPAQELREAVVAFVAAGKPALAWAESYGELGNGQSAYLLASGFSEVWLQPGGLVGLVGLSAEVTFLRGALDRLGVTPHLGQRREYKSAADRIMSREFSPAHEEMIQHLVDSTFAQLVGAISRGRRLDPEIVTSLMDSGPLLTAAALDAGLIDRIGYRDEAYRRARDLSRATESPAASRAASSPRGRPDRDPQLRYAERVAPRVHPLRRAMRAAERSPAVALVSVTGTIAEGRSHRTLTGSVTGSATAAHQLSAAARDRRIGAVVLQVDSPGGSAVASYTIRHGVRQVRSAGKPVIVAMGSYAASGGYLVSCDADIIVACPATLTGSIGVVGGKVDASGLLEKLGLTTGAVETGPRARMFSSRREFSAAEWRAIDAWLDEIYADFVAKVARGRSMDPGAVEAVAKGRVWTGADALDRGLVDRLGGVRDAIDLARHRAGLPSWAPVRPAIRLPLPARVRAPRSSEDPAAARVQAGLPGFSRSGVQHLLRDATGMGRVGDLLMPPIKPLF